MKITKEVISKLKPCKDRFDNYLKFYRLKSHTKAQFLGLKNISHEDKLWVAFRLMPKKNIALAAADIAELVLPLFEAKYPNDKRPRLAIEAARSGSKKKAAAASDATFVSVNAAYAATNIPVLWAAKAAVSAADAAASANAAAYAAATYATYASANVSIAYDAATYATAQVDVSLKKKIRTIVLKYWK